MKQYLNKWQIADWEDLIHEIIELALENNPDKCILALIISDALFQTGNKQKAKAYIQKAKDWNCDEKDLVNISLSGLNTILARIELIEGNVESAVKLYEEALRFFTPNDDVSSLAQIRCTKEAIQLGLLPQVLEQIESLYTLTKTTQDNQMISHMKVLDIEIDLLRDSLYKLKKQYDASPKKNPIVDTLNKQVEHINKSDKSTKQYYGLNALDKKLEAYIDYDNGYFVELGANDGITQSNTYYFEKERNWKGVLIEPILHNFLKCKSNRSKDNYFACTACVSFNYKKKYLKVAYSNLMTAPLEVESDIAEPKIHAKSGEVYLKNGEESIEIVVQAKTITSILDKAKAPKMIDLLSLDVEGAEIEVLKGLKHNKYKFKYILVECRDEQKMIDYLNKYGYEIMDKFSNHDFLFGLKNEKK
ncbi:FkbM family methyltransferase [Sulfurimonas sp.]|uniref:FkbM family methyltransferase n=1 Tax=Sulfurimonas sp. TaxID=2022749 RepID=UPI003D0CDB9F